MNTQTPTKRPRVSKGILVTSSNDATYNTIKALKRLKQFIIVYYNPISYKTVNMKFVTV